jgi:hypothetical protein
VLIDDWATSVELQQATLVSRSTSGALYRPQGNLRLRLLAFGRYEDGWLAERGAFAVWPTAGRQRLSGRLEIPVRAPGPDGSVRIRIREPGSNKLLTFTTKPGRTRTLVIRLCSSGAVTLPFTATPLGGLGDGRTVAAMTGRPRFVPSAAACPASSS